MEEDTGMSLQVYIHVSLHLEFRLCPGQYSTSDVQGECVCGRLYVCQGRGGGGEIIIIIWTGCKLRDNLALSGCFSAWC